MSSSIRKQFLVFFKIVMLSSNNDFQGSTLTWKNKKAIFMTLMGNTNRELSYPEMSFVGNSESIDNLDVSKLFFNCNKCTDRYVVALSMEAIPFSSCHMLLLWC